MKTIFKFGATALIALLMSATAGAAVVASVDRATVELNESFTLKLTVDVQVNVEPDVSALEADFVVGSRSQMSNTTILNGEVTRSRTWSYVLMARRAGNLTIPPITVGPETGNAVPITVAPQSTAAPGEADIFIATEVDRNETYVQAQILYTVRTYRAVATRQPRWSEPAATGVETLVEIVGEEKNYEAMLNDKPYNVSERVYAFFPQESGELSIAPARFEARVLRDGRITGRKVFQSDAINVAINPIPPPPAEYPDAAWLPATAVELRQDWSRDLDSLPAGEPITRHVTIVASGQLQTQLPMLEPELPEGVRVYPDKPELRTVADGNGVRALRRDQYALIGSRPGVVELPEVRLPWWNLTAGEWQVATLPAAALTILPSPDAVVVEAPTEAVVDPAAPAETVVVESRWWRTVSEVLGVVWLATLVAWWWSRQPKNRSAREPEPTPPHKLQARCLKEARKAALAADVSGVKAALLDWGRIQWPAAAPRSVGELATRVTMPLSIELQKMCSASYGPGGRDWDGEATAKALRSFSVLSDEHVQPALDELPPLLPVQSARQA